MSGLYLHVPFCRQACHYCNFHFSTTARYQERMIQCFIKELAMQRDYLDAPLETIYLGGGTPSLLSPDQLRALFAAIQHNYKITDHPEITLEANPDDVTPGLIKTWLNLGINRLSLGVQSFHPHELAWMNRVHRAQQSFESIHWAQEAGLTDLNIDLIYGIPGSDQQSWAANLDYFFQLNLPHLSAYALTVEPKTALHAWIRRGKMAAPDEELANQQFLHLQTRMLAEGFWNYEISNYCRPEATSRHNTAYWQGKPYLGIGPSAHSYNIHNRQWNIAHNVKYMQAIEAGNVPGEREELTAEKKYNEWVMTALRTQWGCRQDDLLKMEHRFTTHFLARVATWMHQGLIVFESSRYILTTCGKLWADRIAADLFYLEE